MLKAVVRHRLAKQAVNIVLYLGLSRLITVIGSAWAARCLGPEKLGISGLIVATMGQMLLFVNCSLDNLFIRKYKNATAEKEREQWVRLAFAQRFFFSIILGSAAVLIACLLHPPAEWWLGIVVAFPLFVLSATIPNWVIVAREDVPTNYKALTLSSVLIALLTLVFFRHGQATGSDLVVQVFGMGLQFYLIGRIVFNQGWHHLFELDSIKKFWPIFWEGRWLFVSGLIVYVYIQLEIPMLGYLSSLAELGKYRMATNLVTSAQQVMGLVSLLLFPRFVEWRKLGVDVLWKKQLFLTGIFSAVGIPLCILVFFISPTLITLIYGAAFTDAAIPFAILFTAKYVTIINGLFLQGLWAQAEDRKAFWVLLPTAIISFCSNLLLMPKFGMLAACSINLLSEILVLLGCYFYAKRHMNELMAKAAQSDTTIISE